MYKTLKTLKDNNFFDNRKLRFNDTAGRIEDGSFRKKMK